MGLRRPVRPPRSKVLPASECLADVVDRLVPYWVDRIIPDLRAGKTVLVAAHGNSLRALVKHLDGIGEDTITELNIPTGIPRRCTTSTKISYPWGLQMMRGSVDDTWGMRRPQLPQLLQ